MRPVPADGGAARYIDEGPEAQEENGPREGGAGQARQQEV